MIDKAIRQGVLERSQGRCEACGKPISGDWECHHRLLRSQGGKDELSNLLALHLDCHAKAHGQRDEPGSRSSYAPIEE
jgi:5-methylcytosine-specific restriction endonuclease McrA